MRKKNQSVEFIKDCFAEALIILMKEMPYSEISVKEICNKAGIARTTYYRHFDNKDGKKNLLLYYVFRGWSIYAEPRQREIEKDFDIVFLHFIYENQDFYRLLYQNNLTEILIEICYKVFGPDEYTPKSLVYIKSYAACGSFGIIYPWIKSNFTDTPEYIQKSFVESLHEILIHAATKKKGTNI